jgi:hypothetical protein
MYRSVLTTRDFWTRTLDRCIKAAATAGVAVFTTNVVDITSINWYQTLSIMLATAIAMFLVNLAEIPVNKTE